MRKILIIIGVIFTFILSASILTTNAYGPTCSEENGIIKCQDSSGAWSMRCNPNLDDRELDACRESIHAFNRERKYNKNLYKRKCNNSYNKRTEFCQELKEKYQTYIFN